MPGWLPAAPSHIPARAESVPAAPYSCQRFVLSAACWTLAVVTGVQERTSFIFACVLVGQHLTPPPPAMGWCQGSLRSDGSWPRGGGAPAGRQGVRPGRSHPGRPAYMPSLPGQAGELGVLSDSSGRPCAAGKGRGELGGDFRLQTKRGGGRREAACALTHSHTHLFLAPVSSGNRLSVLPGAGDTAPHKTLHQ